MAALSRAILELPIHPMKADFTDLLAGASGRLLPRGATIGGLVVPAAVDLLRALAATLGAGSMLLIGIDRV